MKKNIILMLVLSTIMFSCKKENSAKLDNNAINIKKYDVNLKVAGLSLTTDKVGKLKTTAVPVPITNQFGFLDFFVYTDTYKFYKQFKQDSSLATFGKLSTELPDGQYHIYIVGSHAPHANITELFGHRVLRLNTDDEQFYIGETFFSKLNITVNKPKDTSIVLKRATSKVTFKIKDNMPQNASYAIIEYENRSTAGLDVDSGYSLSFPDNGSTDPSTWSFNVAVKNSDKGKANTTISHDAWPYPTPTYRMALYDASNNFIGGKELFYNYNPGLEANTEYIFSGYLFSDNATFQIKIDTAFNDHVQIPLGKKETPTVKTF